MDDTMSYACPGIFQSIPRNNQGTGNFPEIQVNQPWELKGLAND